MTDRLNGLGRLIDNAGGHLSADSPAKRLFSNKQVLGRFAKACLPEFHDLPLETIIGECFDDDYSLQGKRRGASPAEFARGIGTEQILPQDDTLHLDLLFNAWIPGPDSKRQRQFINIEIQKDAKNLERLIGRGIIYNSCIVCSEYGTIFRYPRYEMVEGVNTIWICPAAPSEWAGSTIRFNLAGNNSRGEGQHCLPPATAYDKFRMFFIGANSKTRASKEDVHGLVWTLTTQSLTAAERKEILTEVYEMDMTEALDNSVEESDEWFYNYFGRDNIAKVKEEAKEEVREEVKEEVREETREEERRKNILNMLRLRCTITSIGKFLQIPEDEVIRIARENNIVIP